MFEVGEKFLFSKITSNKLSLSTAVILMFGLSLQTVAQEILKDNPSNSNYNHKTEIPGSVLKPIEKSTDSVTNYIFHDTGYHVSGELIKINFFNYEMTKQLFIPAVKIDPSKFTPNNSALLNAMTDKLETYIKSEKNGKLSQCLSGQCDDQFKQLNGVTEREMASELINSSYCFGTDPFIVASKVRQESKFDIRSISPTGAIGLSQLTGIGLEEILDQFGNRGAKFSTLELKDFINQAIDCYAADDKTQVMSNFPQVSTYVSSRRKSLEYSDDTISKFKKWIYISPSFTSKQRAILVKRQLILGQTLLKIYLAYSYSINKNKQTYNIYEKALRMFNGDKIQVRYAKEVLRKSIINQVL